MIWVKSNDIKRRESNLAKITCHHVFIRFIVVLVLHESKKLLRWAANPHRCNHLKHDTTCQHDRWNWLKISPIEVGYSSITVVGGLYEVIYDWVFPKIMVPQIIHFNRDVHYKPSILGPTPMFGNIHMDETGNSFPHEASQCVCAKWAAMRGLSPSNAGRHEVRKGRDKPILSQNSSKEYILYVYIYTTFHCHFIVIQNFGKQ